MSFWEIFALIVTTVIGIVGILITIKLTRRKKPMWYFRMNRLFQKGISEIDGLNITYKNQAVINLASVYFAFWNDGKDTIKTGDIAEPLRITTLSTRPIYDAQVVFSTKQSNSFEVSLTPDKASAEFNFRYLDHRQGAVIQVLCDCLYIEEITLAGAIMGCKSFKTKKYTNIISVVVRSLFLPLAAAAGVIAGMLVSFITGIPEGSNSFAGFTEAIVLKSPTILAISLYLLIVVTTYIIYRLTNPAKRMPKEIRKHFGNVSCEEQ